MSGTLKATNPLLYPSWADLFAWPSQIIDAQVRAGQKALETMFGAMKVEKPASGSRAAAMSERLKEKAVEPSKPVEVAAAPSATGVHEANKKIRGKVALVTGAGSGIGEAVVRQLAQRGARTVVLVDLNDRVESLAKAINDAAGKQVAIAKVGDATSDRFRTAVFDEIVAEHGVVSICVPAAGITRDRLAVKVDKATGKPDVYPIETFRQVTEVNLIAPIYWALEMVARVAEDRWRKGKGRWEPAEGVQGTIVLIGSVSSQGNKGQISYAVSKAGLEGAAGTLMKEAIFYGVRCGVIHPGFTDTPMVRAMGEDYIAKNILPYTQLRRLIRPEEIADAICFMISNSAVSGELWADAGWHPSV